MDGVKNVGSTSYPLSQHLQFNIKVYENHHFPSSNHLENFFISYTCLDKCINYGFTRLSRKCSANETNIWEPNDCNWISIRTFWIRLYTRN